MSIFVHGGKSLILGGGAELIPDDVAIAKGHWAQRSVEANPANKYVLGKYVQADNPNNNNQYWAHEQLVFGQPSIKNSPMNMLHQARRIVGAFIDTELVYPTSAGAVDGPASSAYIEALGVFWRARFPEELELVERAYSEGKLFFSMECVAEQMELVMPDGRTETFEYKGMVDPSYGEFNDPKAVRKFIKPHFIGGALIIPPAEPGWSHAEIEALAKYSEDHSDMAEDVYTNLSSDAPQLSTAELEQLTLSFMSSAMAAEGTQELIKEDDVTNNIRDEQTAHSIGGEVNVSDNVKTYSEADVKAAIAEATSELKSEIDALRAAADAEATEAKITELEATHEEAIAKLRLELDAAVLKAEEATTELDNHVKWLEEQAEAKAEAERLEAVRAERISEVEEIASFPEEYIEANAERWATMDDEAFASYVDDLKVAQEAAVAKASESDEDKETVVATAMKHVADESGSEDKTFESRYSSLMANRDWIDAV